MEAVKGKSLVAGDIIEDREILRTSHFPHPEDHYLQLVIAKYRTQYVVWHYNKDFCSFNYGHYYQSLEDAEEKFKERCEYYGIVYQ